MWSHTPHLASRILLSPPVKWEQYAWEGVRSQWQSSRKCWHVEIPSEQMNLIFLVLWASSNFKSGLDKRASKDPFYLQELLWWRRYKGVLWSGHSRWLFSSSLHIPYLTTVCFTCILWSSYVLAPRPQLVIVFIKGAVRDRLLYWFP